MRLCACCPGRLRATLGGPLCSLDVALCFDSVSAGFPDRYNRLGTEATGFQVLRWHCHNAHAVEVAGLSRLPCLITTPHPSAGRYPFAIAGGIRSRFAVGFPVPCGAFVATLGGPLRGLECCSVFRQRCRWMSRQMQRSAPCSRLPESDSLEPGRSKALIVVLVTPATRI